MRPNKFAGTWPSVSNAESVHNLQASCFPALPYPESRSSPLRILRLSILLCVPSGVICPQRPVAVPVAPSPEQIHALVLEVTSSQLQYMTHAGPKFRYQVHRVDPKEDTTRELIESVDGSVARLILHNGQPLTTAENEGEQHRLQQLLDSGGPGTRSQGRQTRSDLRHRAHPIHARCHAVHAHARSAAAPQAGPPADRARTICQIQHSMQPPSRKQRWPASRAGSGSIGTTITWYAWRFTSTGTSTSRRAS